MQPLALSHFSIVSALGVGQAATLEGLEAGRSALAPCTFETVELPTFVGQVDGVDEVRLPASLTAFDCRNNRLAAMALASDGFAEAVTAARSCHGADRIGVFLGTSTSGILQTEIAYRHLNAGALPPGFSYPGTHNTFSVASFVQAALGLSGPAMVVSAACASTTKTFANAARAIASGLCDAAIVGGADSLCLTTLYGFHSLMLTAPTPCRPFDAARDGISIGEGAGFALLQRIADDPHADIHVLGVGESSDAYHMSSPHPEGLGARLAMERALRSAGCEAVDIGYVNLHGTATRVGDASEDRAVFGLFGDRVPCGSVKGYTGHTLGASGIVEAGMSALMLRHGFLPRSAGTRDVDPELHSRYLVEGRTAAISRLMSNAFGFGGSNCSLILGKG